MPDNPYYKALESMRYWAAILGATKPPAVVVDNLPEPPLPDWGAERSQHSQHPARGAAPYPPAQDS